MLELGVVVKVEDADDPAWLALLLIGCPSLSLIARREKVFSGTNYIQMLPLPSAPLGNEQHWRIQHLQTLDYARLFAAQDVEDRNTSNGCLHVSTDCAHIMLP